MSEQQWREPTSHQDSAAYEPAIPVVRTSSGDLRVGDAASIEAADDAVRREAARRVARRRGLQAHVVSFAAVNGFLIMIWAITGGGFFWPAFPIGGWGIGLALHAWSVRAAAAREDDVRAEIRRLTQGPAPRDPRS